MFSVSALVIGLVSEDTQIIFIKPTAKKKTGIQNNTGVKTSLKPQYIKDDEVAYLPPRSKQINHLNIVCSKKDKEIQFTYSDVKTGIPTSASCFSVWGSTYHVVVNENGVNQLMEYGKLGFGLAISKAMNSFYSAISYRPPYGYVSGNRKTLPECVELAQPFLQITQAMQEECEEKFPSKRSFSGKHGTIWTETVNCIQDTVNNWKAVIKGLSTFDDSIIDKVDPHVINSEKQIENSFGFTVTQGQSQLQPQQEYCQNKMRHEVDFQLKMCDLNFCQKVKTKLRDESYQQLDEQQKSKLELSDIWEVLLRDRSSKNGDEAQNDPTMVESESEEQNILKQAFLLTKSVPRQSNRAKWKEQSGHAPTMLTLDESVLDGKLREKDMVFCVDTLGNLKKFIVKKEVVLSRGGETAEVVVYEVGNIDKESKGITMPVSSLMLDRGLVFIIPKSMYHIVRGEVEFTDYASQLIQDCVDTNSVQTLYSEHQIPQFPVDDNLLPCDLDLDDTCHETKKRKMQVIESDSDMEEEAEKREGSFAIGEWVVCKFECQTKFQCFLGQIVGNVDGNTKKRRFQFYREEIPYCRVFHKLPDEEEEHVENIVETLPKTAIDIVCGTKIKIMGYELKRKCV